MDEKTILPTTTPTATYPPPIPSKPKNQPKMGRGRHVLARFLIAFCMMALVWTFCGFDMDMDLDDNDGLSEWSLEQMPVTAINTISIPTTDAEHEPVALEAHIMSKCPDARDCLRELVLPAMQKVYTKVNFTLSFIGTPTNSDDGVACMHGPEECKWKISSHPWKRTYVS